MGKDHTNDDVKYHTTQTEGQEDSSVPAEGNPSYLKQNERNVE